MSLQIPVQKDIGEYSEKIFGKMSLRTLICVAAGLCAAFVFALTTTFLLGCNVSDITFFVVLVTMPFFALGFWKPCNMKPEKFLPLLIEHLATNNRLLYCSSTFPNIEYIKTHKTKKQKWKKKGAENYEPSKAE